MNSFNQAGSVEARNTLKAQQRTATLVSLVVALFMMVLIGLILAIILFASTKTEVPQIISYAGQSTSEDKVTKPKVKTEVERKPAAPSMAMSRMITANTSSPTAIPVPQIVVEDVTTDIGVGEGFGAGWGDGSGFGSGGGGASFFGQTTKAQRIAYVIDYSRSMQGVRDKLMRAELTNSLSLMYPGTELGMIFFSGPAWIAGNKVKNGVVSGKGGKKFKWTKGKSHHTWTPDGKLQDVPWLTVTDKQIKRLTKIVKETPLSLGTVWSHPLNMALNMKPAPQVIYFMTDGSASGASKWADEIGKRAKKMGVVINCVALMQPKAEEHLKTIAKMTGGEVTSVSEGGKRKKLR